MAKTKKKSTKYQVCIDSAKIVDSTKKDANTIQVMYRGDIIEGVESSGYVKIDTEDGAEYYIKRTSVQPYIADDSIVDVANINYEDIEKDLEKMQSAYDSSYVNKFLTQDTIGIFGMPYQFMSHVDRRLKTAKKGKEGTIGRKFGEKIVSRMPLLFITPGKQVFMPKYSDDEKKGILASLTDVMSGKALKGSIEDIISKQGRYYEFDFAYNEYYRYVNPMCAATAALLGISNKEVTIGGKTKKLGDFDWKNALNPSFKHTFNSTQNLAFYIDSPTSISETFSNDTTQSPLVSSVNGLSDTAKEINFLLNNTTGTTLSTMQDSGYEDTLGNLNSVIDSMLGGSGVLKSLAGNFSTVLSGGKLIFPEIWSGSDFSRSYNVTIKLRSPDADKLSIFLNIIVPYIHLMALTLPRELNANGYKAPFLIRCFYKGMFNIDMGIITGMDVTRGDEACWTDDGLPTKMDISLSIKDLYTSMFISDNDMSNNGIGGFVQNTALMDYLSNLCGVNMTKNALQRRIYTYYILTKSRFKQTPANLWGMFDQAIVNKFRFLYNG